MSFVGGGGGVNLKGSDVTLTHIVLFFDSSVSPEGCHHPLSTEPLAGHSPHRREPGRRGLPRPSPRASLLFYTVPTLCSQNVTFSMSINSIFVFFVFFNASKDLRLTVGRCSSNIKTDCWERDEHRVSVANKWFHSLVAFTVYNSCWQKCCSLS